MKKKSKKSRIRNSRKDRTLKSAAGIDRKSGSGPTQHSKGLGPKQIGNEAYFFLVICVVAQLATILISWPAWQIRDQPANLPWIAGTPQYPCGIAILVSLVFALISPRKFGVAIHFVVLAVAIGMDQFRCQPQILSIAVLMAACVWPATRLICTWYLVALWTWAGFHKIVSPDWLGHVPYHLLSNHLINAQKYYFEFAVFVAISEIVLGLTAWLRPRYAVLLCLGIHVGIAVFLLLIRWNFSVVPWNLCTALVGAWLLWIASKSNSRLTFPELAGARIVVVVLLLIPVGFYFGVVRHCFAHVLYSGNLPKGVITHRLSIERLDAWKTLSVPFPNVQQAYRDYFVATGVPGEKLHIHEPRINLQSHFYELTGDRRLNEISSDEFFGRRGNHVAGIAHDDPRKLFQLELGHATMLKRAEDEMIYAIKFAPEYFQSEQLALLDGLPNLEQIQLAGCDVRDDDLRQVSGLKQLTGIGLNQTPITDAGLKHLRDLPVAVVEHEDTQITEAGLLELGL